MTSRAQNPDAGAIALPGGGIALTTARAGAGFSLVRVSVAAKAIGVTALGGKFRGEPMLMGETYLTAYDPIKNDSGTVIGALFVGLSKSSLRAGAETVRAEIMLYGGVIAATILVLLFVVLRQLLGPI